MRSLSKWVLVFMLLAVMLPLGAQDDEDNFDALVNMGGEFPSTYLVGPEGMTLYRFALDDALCVDQCLENWPPLTVGDAGDLSLEEGIPGVLGTFEREDGTIQVTYNGIPLYYWQGDEVPGDTTGDRVNRVWFIVEPVQIAIGGNEELGEFLVGPQGMTLYVFTQDTPDTSVCTEECAENWPPFTVESDADLTVSRDVPGIVGLIEREDGGLQITYNQRPLYYWQGDENIGDATGQGVNDSWFVFPPETVAVRETDDRGSYITSGNSLSLYASAEEAQTNDILCVEDCTETWIPFIVAENEVVYGGQEIEGELSVVTRPDGSLQVAYNRLPLYFYVGDIVPNDRTGDGIDDNWYLVEVGMNRNQILNMNMDFGDDDEGGEGDEDDEEGDGN